MLSPKKFKYRKRQKRISRTILGKANSCNTIAFGEYGMMSLSNGFITSRQIEAARIAMTRKLKREGRVWIRIFPSIPITKKPLEVRMGSGKGSLDHWSAAVKPGTIMFEIGGIENEELVHEALRLATNKLPIKTKVVKRLGLVWEIVLKI